MSNLERTKVDLLNAKIVFEEADNLDIIVEEVDYALYPPTHEQKYPTYSCLISIAAPHLEQFETIDALDLPVDVARELSDGITTFLHRSLTGKQSLITSLTPHDDERVLHDISIQSAATLVHRDNRGRVRIFTEEAIFVYASGNWEERPLAGSVVGIVKNAIPQINQAVVESALEFAFHVLSPANIGATLVLWLNDQLPVFSSTLDVSSSRLNLCNSLHFSPLRSLLSKHDGATLFDVEGKVKSIENQLPTSIKSLDIINQDKGTRHTSARRFSFDELFSIVIVVSEDGPVSVYSDGVKVTELQQFNTGELAKDLDETGSKGVYNDFDIVRCKRCGKFIDVETVLIAEMNELEEGTCPVCGASVHTRMCWQINTRLIKRVSREKGDVLYEDIKEELF